MLRRSFGLSIVGLVTAALASLRGVAKASSGDVVVEAKCPRRDGSDRQSLVAVNGVVRIIHGDTIIERFDEDGRLHADEGPALVVMNWRPDETCVDLPIPHLSVVYEYRYKHGMLLGCDWARVGLYYGPNHLANVGGKKLGPEFDKYRVWNG